MFFRWVDTGSIPIRAQQIVVPVLAVGLCYGLESEAVSLMVDAAQTAWEIFQ